MNNATSDLIDAYLDGNLTTEQGERLQELLRNDPEARAALRRRATVDEGLTDLATASGDGENMATGNGTATRAVGSRLPVIIPWGVAAALALALLFGRLWSPDPAQETGTTPRPFLGLLVDEVAAEFESGFGPDDVRFVAREYRLQSGAIHVRLENGADLVMRAPAAFRLHGPFDLELLDGGLRAVVPTSAEGLTIAAPNVHYEDRGTEFGVSVDRASGASRVHVFDGQVNATEATSKQLLYSVTSGQSMQFADGEWKPAATPDVDEFLAPGQIGLLRWRQWRERFVQDPSLVAFYSFERDANEPGELANDTGQASGGTIRGARWVSGRWPGKDALLFDRDSDSVGLTIPGEYDEFTLSFWVKVDRLDYEYNALLNADGWELGDLHFQIKRTGLAWANVNGKKRSHPEFAGEPITLGRWQHIVGVISRTDDSIRTYVNGKLMWEQKCQLKNPVIPGACSLGNWVDIPEKWQPTRRAFKGRMDEVAIWSRALAEQEIETHYEAGRPSLLDD
jgi:ferric-dicitrate binding protein FerR (iron transport regulator)